MSELNLKIKLLTPTAKAPKRALTNDLGMDLYLDDLNKSSFDFEKDTFGCRLVYNKQEKVDGIDIFPGGLAKLPLGFAASFNPDWGAFVFDKSGVGFKGIKYLGGVIDPDYREEWTVVLCNIKTFNEIAQEPVRFLIGQKIAQVCFLSVGRDEATIVEELDKTERVGGFGSTGAF